MDNLFRYDARKISASLLYIFDHLQVMVTNTGRG